MQTFSHDNNSDPSPSYDSENIDSRDTPNQINLVMTILSITKPISHLLYFVPKII